jgi:hypothetical protein
VRLTLYICLTRLTLGIERGEGKIKVMVGRLAGIDGAAQKLADEAIHATAARIAAENKDWECHRAAD